MATGRGLGRVLGTGGFGFGLATAGRVLAVGGAGGLATATLGRAGLGASLICTRWGVFPPFVAPEPIMACRKLGKNKA